MGYYSTTPNNAPIMTKIWKNYNKEFDKMKKQETKQRILLLFVLDVIFLVFTSHRNAYDF